MLKHLRSLLSAPQEKQAAHAQYITLVEQSRNPFFYTECSVPDTLNGRFDVIVLHIFLFLRTRKDKQNAAQARSLLEVLFEDMDRSLREMGVGDTGIARRMKAMSQAAFGRLTAYENSWGNDDALKETVMRNIYRGAPPSSKELDALFRYIREY